MTKRNGGSGDENVWRQVSKTAKHAQSLPAINVSKWRTTNDISPRISASNQAIRRFAQVLIFGEVAPSTFPVYRGTKFREIGGCYPQDIVLYLVPSCVNAGC